MLSTIANWTCRREELRLVGWMKMPKTPAVTSDALHQDSGTIDACRESDQIYLGLNGRINKMLQSKFWSLCQK